MAILRHLGETNYNGKEIVEIMSNSTCKCTNYLHFLTLLYLLFQHFFLDDAHCFRKNDLLP
ncbi:MAG: hypothetical protein GY799_03625 [Desulfobulbaceae bacterium]|nr:hypothetical protein [Desulfobulbaceae bacterium]